MHTRGRAVSQEKNASTCWLGSCDKLQDMERHIQCIQAKCLVARLTSARAMTSWQLSQHAMDASFEALKRNPVARCGDLLTEGQNNDLTRIAYHKNDVAVANAFGDAALALVDDLQQPLLFASVLHIVELQSNVTAHHKLVAFAHVDLQHTSIFSCA